VISENRTLPNVEPPVVQWTPSPAMCGLDVYTGDRFAKWKGDLFAGALKMEEVKRLTLDASGKVVNEEVILKNAGRVRDVQAGPDGAIYVVLNGPHAVLRLTPRE
jgi:glucose/arabinose dehydrogenase